MPAKHSLNNSFKPESYAVDLKPIENGVEGRVKILGRKIGRPSKRLTFHQKGLKITSAQITKLDKTGRLEIEVSRINHHRRYEEVRLHTGEMLYPGNYEIEITYIIDASRASTLQKLDGKPPNRNLMPLIDEAEALAEFKLSG